MKREDLKGLKYSQEWVTEQINKYKEQREMVYGLNQNTDGMPKAQNKPNYALEELIDSYNELLNIFAKEQEKINKIIEQINMLEPIHKIVLTKRYLSGESMEKISAKIGYNYYDTCRIHGKALNEFDKLHKKSQDFSN